jgi:hypothetical protein
MATKKKKLWWIYDQEEVVVATCYAITKGGAFAAFEEESGLDRESFRAAEMKFRAGCALSQ